MAENFGQKFRENILTKQVPLVLNEDENFLIFQKDKEFKKSYKYDFTTYKKYFNFNIQEDMQDNIILEKELFEFSNRIGAFVIYTLIQFMNPDNISGNEVLTRRTNEELTKK
jgi:hypothetical protein